MRRLLQLATLLLLAALPIHAQTFDVCWGTNEASGSASTVTVSVSPTGGAGHILYGFAKSGSNTTNTITFSDNSGSNTWTAIGSLINNSNVGQVKAAGSVNIATGGTYTVTATFGTSNKTYRSITVCEFHSTGTAAIDTGTASCNQNFSSTTCATGAFSTTTGGLVVYAMGNNGTGLTYTAGAIGANTAAVRTTNSNALGLESTTFASAQTGITANMTFGSASALAIAGTFKWTVSSTFVPQVGAFMPGP